MTDLLFYLPHNSSLLIDCDYQFTNEGQATLKAKIEKLEKEKDELEEHWFELKSAGYIRDPAEKILVEKIDALQRQLLPSTDVFDKAVKEFQDDLRPIDRKYSEEIAELGFPMVEPPSGLTDKGEIKKYKRTMCMGAGIQY
jgi:hypothetical protein